MKVKLPLDDERQTKQNMCYSSTVSLSDYGPLNPGTCAPNSEPDMIKFRV